MYRLLHLPPRDRCLLVIVSWAPLTEHLTIELFRSLFGVIEVGEARENINGNIRHGDFKLGLISGRDPCISVACDTRGRFETYSKQNVQCNLHRRRHVVSFTTFLRGIVSRAGVSCAKKQAQATSTRLPELVVEKYLLLLCTFMFGYLHGSQSSEHAQRAEHRLWFTVVPQALV